MMPSVHQVNSIETAIAFVAWTFAVVALTKAIFGSFPAMEVSWWLHQRGAGRREKMTRLNWEVTNRARFDPDVVSKSPHAAKQNLTTAEHARKLAELQKLARGSLPWRAGQFFAGCFACQSFWSAAVLYLAVGGPAIEVFTSALGYSGAAVAMKMLLTAASTPDKPTGKQNRGCSGCG